MLIYFDICVFRYIDKDGCKLYAVDIVTHDIENKIWYVNVSYNIHIVAFLHCICCDAPKPRGPLTTRQPAENLYVSYHETHT